MCALHALRSVAEEDTPPYKAEPQKRDIGFGIVDPQVRALKNGYATAVYEVLAAHTNAQGVCWPPLTTICEAVGWSKPTVIKAIKALCDAGVVAAEQQRHHGYVIGNRYTLPLRNRTKSTTLNQCPPIKTEAVNDVESGGKPPLPRQSTTLNQDDLTKSTTLTQAVNDVYSSGKGGLHKQDVVKQDSRKQDEEVTASAVTGEQAPQPATPEPKPKTKTQSEKEQAAFALVDGYAVGSGRLKKDVVGRERYDARVAFTPLIDRYTAEDIQGCTSWLKSDPFYQRGNMGPLAVVKALPDWEAAGRPDKMTPSNGRTPVETWNGSPVFDYRGQPTTAYFLRQVAQLEAEEASKEHESA